MGVGQGVSVGGAQHAKTLVPKVGASQQFSLRLWEHYKAPGT